MFIPVATSPLDQKSWEREVWSSDLHIWLPLSLLFSFYRWENWGLENLPTYPSQPISKNRIWAKIWLTLKLLPFTTLLQPSWRREVKILPTLDRPLFKGNIHYLKSGQRWKQGEVGQWWQGFKTAQCELRQKDLEKVYLEKGRRKDKDAVIHHFKGQKVEERFNVFNV